LDVRPLRGFDRSMVTPAAALDPSKSASHFIEVYGFFKWERWRREFFLVGRSLPASPPGADPTDRIAPQIVLHR
jgi:hypothetical protein